jgi:hypothetical protein
VSAICSTIDVETVDGLSGGRIAGEFDVAGAA